jgi:hypothetical protein
MHRQALEYVFPASQVQPSHPAPIKQMLIPSLQLLAALA